jgi:hypothetical protein
MLPVELYRARLRKGEIMRTRRRLTALVATGLAVLAVGAGGAGAITNGSPDGDQHPYVGFMIGINFTQEVAWACSGSLIAESVFLTAGHCTDGAEEVRVWFDEEWPSSFTGYDALGTAHTNPDFCIACGNGLPGFAYRDVGVVTFDATPGDVPTEYASLPTAGQVDALKNKTPIDFVGYGVTFQAQIPGNLLPQPPPFYRWDGLGTRMYAPSALISGRFTHSDEFMRLALNPGGGSGGTCFGDSGGPDLLGGTDTVLAVNSYVANVNCGGTGYSQRIDIPEVLEWIEDFFD